MTHTRHGRGLGCEELERWDPRNNRFPAYGLIGAGIAPVARASMADLVFVPPGYSFADQETLQSCTGWAYGTQLIHVRTRAMGLPPITPSPNGCYYQGRARRYGWAAIWDGGANPHEVLASMVEAGIVRYEDWPHDVRHVNDCPPPGAYRLAADVDAPAWLRYHWVLSTGAERTAEVCSLLASRRPVAGAWRVDQGLEDWRPGHEPWRRTGTILGGHAMCIVGFDTMSNGRKVFVVANSWGGSWGDAGFGLFSQEALESDECTYLVTPDIDPLRIPQ